MKLPTLPSRTSLITRATSVSWKARVKAMRKQKTHFKSNVIKLKKQKVDGKPQSQRKKRKVQIVMKLDSLCMKSL